ncbi:OTU domain containing protein [Parasponia andersonii]|uniref:ubiquitinyl hydrolase 1 n=1 Tax=Parasponia andersonii TaxID=3476 RepID=A0A2P5AFD5_PARAD|nr:OTU domain containing protein [Parasponia andersonii]
MTTDNWDPDVKRWNLHLLDVCTLSNDISHSTVTGYDPDFSKVEYVREGYVESCSVEPCHMENDEVIAHAYQEELSRLATAEVSGRPDFGEDHLQASILAQDWFGPSKRHEHENGWKMENGHDSNGNTDGHNNNENAVNDYRGDILGNENNPSTRINEEVEDGMGAVFTYSVPGEHQGENLGNGEDWSYSLDITDESPLDSEVGRRLNHMVPVPHVPRIIEKLPSIDEEISDYERLLDRLQVYDLVERKVQGDGNCQFRALSDQLYRSADHHGFVREQIIQQLNGHPEMYEGYVPMGYADYLKKMSKSGEWGDHVTLQAAADWYGVKIFVITSFRDTCYIEILPHTEKSKRGNYLLELLGRGALQFNLSRRR